MASAREAASTSTLLHPGAVDGPAHPYFVGTIRLTGTDELIDAHSAHQQPRAPEIADGRRTDRNYPPGYDGENPEWWPQTRAVPAYRPLNRNVDHSNRPWAANGAEIVFVRSMLTGVLFIGVFNKAWRNTFGRITKDVWTYPTGGYF